MPCQCLICRAQQRPARQIPAPTSLPVWLYGRDSAPLSGERWPRPPAAGNGSGEIRPHQPSGAGVSLPPQLPIVPAGKPQVQVERPQAKPRTNDLEVRRAVGHARPARKAPVGPEVIRTCTAPRSLSGAGTGPKVGPELTREATRGSQCRQSAVEVLD